MRERGILVGLFDKHATMSHMERRISELEDLSRTLSVDIQETIVQKIQNINPATYMGFGKVEELKEAAVKLKAKTLILSVPVSPMQLRNLEDRMSMKVIDRNELILSIFAKNASSNISMAEVELAQYRYLLPRLTGKGIMMSRLGGGIGTRGPGETKLETDRRHIEKKIDFLKKKLEHYKKNIDVRNKNRSNVFNVCLIGYTNAGKTRIMSRLVSEGFVSDDKLFTTLDTVTRKLNRSVVLTDTVGFLGELPHEIIKSFELTIEEAAGADLKLIVIDISDKYVQETIDDLHKIIEDLSLNKNERLYVFNKTDVLVNTSLLNHYKDVYQDSIFISAKTGENIDILKKRIMDIFLSKLVRFDITADPSSGDMIKFINTLGHGVKQKIVRNKLVIEFYMSVQNANNFKKKFGDLL